MAELKHAARRRLRRTPMEFDPDIARSRDKVLADWANYIAGYQKNVNQSNLDYTTGRRSTDVAQPNIMRNLLNNAASRGMAYSTGYATDVGNAKQSYADQLGQLNMSHSQQLADLASGKNTALNQKRFQLQDLLRQQNDRAIAAAAKRRQQRLHTRSSLGMGG